MSWVRLDDGFIEHDKVADLSDRAFRLHVGGLCYSSRKLTDGYLNDRAVSVVCAIINAKRPALYVAELVKVGLWREAENGDGYWINDYLEYNPDAETVKARMEQRRQAGKSGGHARWGTEPPSESLDEPPSERGSESSSRFVPPGPYPSPQVNPNRPVGDNSPGKVNDLAAIGAALELFQAIRTDHTDAGTRQVVTAYAQELSADDFREVRTELVKRRHRIRNEAKWVNGALKRRAMKAHASRTAAA